jgi:integrase
MPGAHRPREFMEEELLDANPARGFIVKPGDPRLQPLRPARRRRAVPPAEIHKFMRVVRPRSVAACWAPLLTGARPGELFATRGDDIDRDLELSTSTRPRTASVGSHPAPRRPIISRRKLSVGVGRSSHDP